jgi:hypothetical protein
VIQLSQHHDFEKQIGIGSNLLCLSYAPLPLGKGNVLNTECDLSLFSFERMFPEFF